MHHEPPGNKGICRPSKSTSTEEKRAENVLSTFKINLTVDTCKYGHLSGPNIYSVAYVVYEVNVIL